MAVVVIYAGGFQPFHIGHLSSYLQAKKEFPEADFYIAASGDVKERPIPYDEKKFLAVQAGVDPQDFPDIIVKSPLNPKEILSKYDPQNDIFILVRSERDPVSYTKKDGTPGYFQPYEGLENAKPFGKHAYVFVTKKQDFKLNDQEVYSGTQVRNLYSNADDKSRANIINQLYPNSKRKATIKSILDKHLVPNIQENLLNLIKQTKPYLKEATVEQKTKLLKLIMEAQIKAKSNLTKTADYLPEK